MSTLAMTKQSNASRGQYVQTAKVRHATQLWACVDLEPGVSYFWFVLATSCSSSAGSTIAHAELL